jgi:hypothetical protein
METTSEIVVFFPGVLIQMVFPRKAINVTVTSLDWARVAGILGVLGSNVAVQIGFPRKGRAAIWLRAPVIFNMVLEVFVQRIGCLEGFDFPVAARPCATINVLTLRANAIKLSRWRFQWATRSSLELKRNVLQSGQRHRSVIKGDLGERWLRPVRWGG